MRRRHGCRGCNRGVASLSLAFEFLLQQLVHLTGVGLAFGSLHRLADEEAEHLAALGFVAGAVLFDLLGVGRQHFVQHGFDGAGVGDLLEALLLDDLVCRAFAGGHGFEDHLGDLAADGVVLDAQDHAAQLFGCYRRLLSMSGLPC